MLAKTDRERCIEHLVQVSEQEWNGERSSYQKEAAACQKRLQELLNSYTRKTRNAKQFAELVERYTDITELDEALLLTLIDKALVH